MLAYYACKLEGVKSQHGEPKKLFYGYWIVVAGFVVSVLNSGLGFYGYSVINKPIGDYFGWSRSEVTAAFLVYSIAVAVASFGVGRLVDRRGPRQVLLLGAVVMSLTLALLSQTSALWNYYLLHIFLGIGAALTGPIAVSINISSWFYRLRGTMQGIAFIGIGIGGMAIAPLLGNYLIPNIGWSGSYLVMAGLMLVLMLPLVLWVMKDRPQQKGVMPYGWEGTELPGEGSSDIEEVTGYGFKDAMATVAFWMVVVTAAFYGMSMTAALHNQVSILTVQGFTAGEAVAAVGGVGLFSAIGKLVFGYLCDRIDPKYAMAISYVLVVGSLIALIQASSLFHVWIYVALLGLGMGGWVPNLAMMASGYFGMKHFGLVLGAFHMFFLGGESFGPMLAGFFYDQTGSYRMILTVFMVLTLVSIPLIATIRRPRALG